MENWILTVNDKQCDFEAAQREWLKNDVFIHTVHTLSEALSSLFQRDYLLVVICSDNQSYMNYLPVIHDIKHVPIVILTPKFSASEKEKALRLGADEYILRSGEVAGDVAAARDVVQRYHTLESHDELPGNVLTYKEIFVCQDQRKVFVEGSEVKLSSTDFNILCLLMSKPGRTFEYGQIYYHVYGDDARTGGISNAVQCHIKEIRNKIKTYSQSATYIQTVRGIGYRIEKE